MQIHCYAIEMMYLFANVQNCLCRYYNHDTTQQSNEVEISREREKNEIFLYHNYKEIDSYC